MTVVHDASGGSGSTTVVGNVDHTHTPVSTPRGAVVLISQVGSGDEVSSVSYGGVAMTRIRFQPRSVTETCSAYTYFLGASIPTGAQTVRMVTTAGSTKACRSQTVTAAADTEVDADETGGTGLAANPSLSMDPSAQAVIYYANASGLNTPVSTPESGTTQITTQDLGAISAHFGRKQVSAGATTIGWTSASDDFAHAALSVIEQAAPPDALPKPPVVAPTAVHRAASW